MEDKRRQIKRAKNKRPIIFGNLIYLRIKINKIIKKEYFISQKYIYLEIQTRTMENEKNHSKFLIQ